MWGEGRLWPSEEDRKPLRDTFCVPVSALTAVEYLPGSAELTVVEQPDSVDERLRAQFPLYRLARFGQRILGMKVGVNEV